MYVLLQLVTGSAFLMLISAINTEREPKNVLCSSLRTPEGYIYHYDGMNAARIHIRDANNTHIASILETEKFETDTSVVKFINLTSIVLSECRSLEILKDMVSLLMYNVTDDVKRQQPLRTPSPPPPEQQDNPENTLKGKVAVPVCGLGLLGIALVALCMHRKTRSNKAARSPQPEVAIEMEEFRDGHGGQQQESEENESNQETERALLPPLLRRSMGTDDQNPGGHQNRHTNGGPRLPDGARCRQGDTEETTALVDKQVQGKQSNDDQASENSHGREEQPNGVEFAGQKYDP